MKLFTIGRGNDCDIIISDNHNLISRHHAVLRIYPLGKMELIPDGRNGTFVNGFPIKNGIPHKVSRKDVVSFAHARQLDWSSVKDNYRIARIVLLILISTILISCGIFALLRNIGATNSVNADENSFITPVSNTGNESGQHNVTAVSDSISAIQSDSISAINSVEVEDKRVSDTINVDSVNMGKIQQDIKQPNLPAQKNGSAGISSKKKSTVDNVSQSDVSVKSDKKSVIKRSNNGNKNKIKKAPIVPKSKQRSTNTNNAVTPPNRIETNDSISTNTNQNTNSNSDPSSNSNNNMFV